MKTSSFSSSRRRFLKVTGATALAIPLAGRTVLGANNTVRMAVLGCGGRAAVLASQFSKAKDSEVVALCDPDTAQMDKLVGKLKKKGVDLSKAEKVVDFRKVLERKDIDAVCISAPNYWHTPMAIAAMAAGKDVYVEKPVSHSVWEGQQLIAAEKKYDRIIAGGFQNRSDPGPQEGIKYVQEGNLGKILAVHATCFRNRSSIGKQDTPLKPPETCDYNLWLGPCQDKPIFRPKFHYHWHWDFNTGNGDVGNQAPHEIDMACWVLGDSPLPTAINSFGGRFGWNDGGDTPNMMGVWYEQAGVPCIIEVNDMKLAPDLNASPARKGIRVGIIVTCEGGELRGGRGGMKAYGDDGKTMIKKFQGNGGPEHQQIFLDAVRSRKRDLLTSNIVAAERSSALAHLANVSYLSGGPADVKTVQKAISGLKMLETILEEQTKQLVKWGLDKPPYTLGNEIEVDPATATVTTPDADPRLIKKDYRKEFAVPEIV